MAEKIKKTIRISEENNAKVTELSEQLGLTHQEIIDLAIEAYNSETKLQSRSGVEDAENLSRTVRQLEKNVYILVGAMNSLLSELGYKTYHSPDYDMCEILEDAQQEIANKILERQTRRINRTE